MPKKLSDIGEFGLLARLLPLYEQRELIVLGPGDDAAVLATPDGRVVAATDILVEGSHFRRDWSSARDVGCKAAAQNFADIAAMGAVPTALLVGFSAPSDLPIEWAVGLSEGLRAECERVGASVIGGDTVRGDLIVVAVTVLGDLQGRDPVTRGGARPGDVVAINGRLGWAEAGLAVLSRDEGSPSEVVTAHRCPDPPYEAGPQAALAGATAMIDVSDGLIQDLSHIATASGVAIDVDPGLLEISQPVRDAGRALDVDPLRWVLTGGEDHALVACFPPAADLAEGWRVIGRVAAGVGVTVAGRPYEGAGGHNHFGTPDH